MGKGTAEVEAPAFMPGRTSTVPLIVWVACHMVFPLGFVAAWAVPRESPTTMSPAVTNARAFCIVWPSSLSVYKAFGGDTRRASLEASIMALIYDTLKPLFLQLTGCEHISDR